MTNQSISPHLIINLPTLPTTILLYVTTPILFKIPLPILPLPILQHLLHRNSLPLQTYLPLTLVTHPTSPNTSHLNSSVTLHSRHLFLFVVPTYISELLLKYYSTTIQNNQALNSNPRKIIISSIHRQIPCQKWQNIFLIPLLIFNIQPLQIIYRQ